MDFFEESRFTAFREFSNKETITRLDIADRPPNLQQYVEVWEVVSLYEDPDGRGRPFTMHVCFHESFPLKIPAIYLDQKAYDAVKYIPHVDSEYLVCTFDSETTRTNPGDPFGIVDSCVRRTKEIIKKGLRKENFQEFKDEFMSYWECRDDEPKKPFVGILSLIEVDPSTKEVKLLKFKNKFGNFEFILYQKSEGNDRFMKHLKEKGYEWEAAVIFYSDKVPVRDSPPFALSNRQAIQLIKASDPSRVGEFTKKINKSEDRFMVLTKKNIDGQDHYLGWFHSFPVLNQPGFRAGKLNAFGALSFTVQGANKVRRITVNEFSEQRMSKRTAGTEKKHEYTFLVAGLGSVGSNLIHFLNSLSFPGFKLIDPEFLNVENIGRHLLGMNYLNVDKVDALQDYLQGLNPKQKIETRSVSITKVLENEHNFVDECDCLFVAIGKHNIEEWIAEKILNGSLKKPVFILWVEPYLAGGHMIYIDPADPKFKEFYTEKDDCTFFIGNVVNVDEYIAGNRTLVMKEAGCQTSYVPYSGSNLVLFLSAIYPHILQIIKDKSKGSCGYTWIGDKKALADLQLELSDIGKNNPSFTVIKHEI